MLTVAEHVKKLRARFPNCGPNEADSLIWQSIQDNCNEYSWAFLLKEGKVITEASYNTGTLAVVNGSASVTLTGGTWSTSWTVSPSTRKILIAGRSESYGITITGAATGTLDSVWIGADDTAATYQMFRDVYPLPIDCDFAREYMLLDPARNRAVDFVEYGTFHREYSWLQNAPGIPACVTRVGLTTSQAVVGVPQIKFGPQPPSSQEVYVLLYFQKPTKTAITAYPSPLWPEKIEDLIFRRAIWQYAENHDLPSLLRLKDEYLGRFFDAQSDHNGKAAMRQRLRSTCPDAVANYDNWFQGTYPRATYP